MKKSRKIVDKGRIINLEIKLLYFSSWADIKKDNLEIAEKNLQQALSYAQEIYSSTHP